MAGTWVVTATHNEGLTATATITVSPGALDHILIRTASGNGGIEAGVHSMTTDETWTLWAAGYDADDNYIEAQVVDWATTGSLDSQTHNGSSFTFTPTTANTSGTITAEVDGGIADATGTITVNVGTLDHVDLTPDAAARTAGEYITYTLTAYDGDGNDWDVTSSGKYTTTQSAGGTWVTNVYTAGNPGTWTITATYQGVTDTATLTVTHKEYTLTVNISGTGSVDVDPSGPYHYGNEAELTANPGTGWSFDSWSGDLTGSTNPDSITMNGNKTVTANFIQAAPPEPDHFDIDLPPSAKINEPFEITITALDQNDHLINDFNDTVSLSTDVGIGDIIPDSVTLNSGTWTGNVTVRSSGERIIIVTFNSVNKGQENITITSYQIFLPIVMRNG